MVHRRLVSDTRQADDRCSHRSMQRRGQKFASGTKRVVSGTKVPQRSPGAELR